MGTGTAFCAEQAQLLLDMATTLCAVPTVSPLPCLPQGLFLRLFYPCQARAGAVQPLWIPRPEYCGGLADAALGRRWCSALLSIAVGEGGHPHPGAPRPLGTPTLCLEDAAGRAGAEQGPVPAAASLPGGFSSLQAPAESR